MPGELAMSFKLRLKSPPSLLLDELTLLVLASLLRADEAIEIGRTREEDQLTD
jgi:hypothetical protein